MPGPSPALPRKKQQRICRKMHLTFNHIKYSQADEVPDGSKVYNDAKCAKMKKRLCDVPSRPH